MPDTNHRRSKHYDNHLSVATNEEGQRQTSPVMHVISEGFCSPSDSASDFYLVRLHPPDVTFGPLRMIRHID